jgi:hypothetical protein
MKFDKEFLIKHLFWVLSGVAVILAFVSLLYLKFPVYSKITKAEKDIVDKLKKLQSPIAIKGPEVVKEAERKAQVQRDLRTVVWQQAAAGQANLMTWPKGFEERYHYSTGLFAMAIKADPRSTTPADAPKAESPKGEQEKKPEEEASGTFEGLIRNIDENVITVVGNNNQVKEFLRTARIKITLTDDKQTNAEVFWRDIGEARDRIKVTVTWQRGKYFGDDITDVERDRFADTYAEQLPDIVKQVDPYTDKGGGVVQLKGWLYSETSDPVRKVPLLNLPPGSNVSFLNYVDKRGDPRATHGHWITDRNPDMYKEIWTAQEDLWIQRELYKLIAKANNYISLFKGQGGDGKGKVFTFSNPYWELKLMVTPTNALQGKIKNLSARRQRLDVSFKVKVRKTGEPEVLFIQGNPVDPGVELDLHPVKNRGDSVPPGAYALQTDLPDKDSFVRPASLRQPTGIYGVEQVLTWETAAVKRIDQISLGKGVAAAAGGPAPGGPTAGRPGRFVGSPGGRTGAGNETSQSQRTCVTGLKPFRWLLGDKKDNDPNAPPPDTGNPAAPPTVGSATSLNGFVFDRYYEMTDQARRVPVGLVLIVDQEHVGRVQAAFADSVLRFVTTQVILNRYPNPLRPSEAPLVVASNPGTPTPFGPGGRLPFQPPMGRGGMPSQPSPGASGGGDDSESNMELVLYGIVSLYERFPPRPVGGP